MEQSLGPLQRDKDLNPIDILERKAPIIPKTPKRERKMAGSVIGESPGRTELHRIEEVPMN
jgi:hypothetical protein